MLPLTISVVSIYALGSLIPPSLSSSPPIPAAGSSSASASASSSTPVFILIPTQTSILTQTSTLSPTPLPTLISEPSPSPSITPKPDATLPSNAGSALQPILMTAGETTVPLGMRSTLLSAYKSWISGLEEYDYVTQIVSHFFPTAYPTNVPLALTSLYNAWTSAGSTPWDFYTDVQSFVQSVTAVEGDLSEGLIGKAAFSTLLWYSAGAEQTMTGLTSVWEEESSSEAAAGAAFSSQFFRTHTPKIIPTTATTTGLSASNTLVFWETPSLVPSPTPPGPEPSYTGDPFLTDASSPAAGRTLQNRPFAWIFSVVAMAMLALWISPVAAIYQVAGIAFVELYVVFIVMGRV